jgi:hypothetical protein
MSKIAKATGSVTKRILARFSRIGRGKVPWLKSRWYDTDIGSRGL